MANPVLSEDQFLCSICLDVFTEPVSTPCGHNFCKACNAKHWEGKDQCVCPLCNERFSKGLKLHVNTGFREVVENFKKHHAIADSQSKVKPGQVPCDCCPGQRKAKAAKTCLVCLTSFCETHLEPHHRVAILKGHKLTSPVHNLEDKICKKHNRILELLCRSDLTRVCVLCTEHGAHDTVPLQEAYVNRNTQIGVKKAEVQKVKPKRGKRAKKTKMSEQRTRKGKDEARANSVEYNFMQFPSAGRYSYLPDNVGISRGKFYYEVETKGGTCWYIGVIRESQLGRSCTLNSSNGNWIINLDNNKCTALQDSPVDVFLTRRPETVRVFVDYDNGLVSFYDADILIYTFTDCDFNESITLFKGYIAEDNWLQRLRNNVPDSFLVLILIVVFMISLGQNETE